MNAFNQTGQQVGTQINAPAPTKRISELIADAVAAEREECAKIADFYKQRYEHSLIEGIISDISHVIRARGDK